MTNDSMPSTDSRTTWTFEVEGSGVPDGYYTPKED